MSVRLVKTIHELPMDASVHPWDVRMKYTKVSELLYDYETSNARIGRQHCPVCEYFRAHLDDDILDVEHYVYSHEEWGPPSIAESLHQTLLFNDGVIAAWAQHYLALNLVRYHPYARARGSLEKALKHPRLRLYPGAAYVLLSYINAGHPNPRRLLEKPEVRGKFPEELAVELFPAPDFEVK